MGPIALGCSHTGGVTEPLLQRLRRQARSPSHPTRPQAAWLLQYTVARGRHLGRIGDNFGAACDQIDRADALLEGLHERVAQNRPHPEQADGDWRERIALKPRSWPAAMR